MTPSRRHLFALLGLVLPVAAFTASPVSAATSNSMQPKSHDAPRLNRVAQVEVAPFVVRAQCVAPRDAPAVPQVHRQLTSA